MRRILAVAVLVAGCSSAGATPFPGATLRAGDRGLFDLPDGRYRFAWSAPGCSFFRASWAPTYGAPEIFLPTDELPAGSAVIDVVGGSGYVNRGGDCDYVVTVSRAN